MMPMMLRIVVDFPAPFGPSSAMISPFFTSNEIFEMICLSLNDLPKPSTASIVSMFFILSGLLFQQQADDFFQFQCLVIEDLYVLRYDKLFCCVRVVTDQQAAITGKFSRHRSIRHF